MLYRLGMAVLIIVSMNIAAADYRELPLKEKIKDKDLTFAVTFDKLGCNADFAKGNPNSTTLSNLNLGLRGLIGFDTQQGFCSQGNEELKFSVSNNIEPSCGTVSLWLSALDYAPGEELTEGKKRGNITLLNLVFKQKNRFVEYQLYEYGDTVYFDWLSSEPPHGWGQIGRVQVVRKGIKQKQWHQLVITYDAQKIAIYLNGVLGGEATLPVKASKTLDIKPDGNMSFLGIRSRFFDDKGKWNVAVDDIKVYSRVMSPLEIRNQYQKLLLGQNTANLQAFEVKLNGVDEGDSHALDQIEAEFDLGALPDEAQKELNAGTLNIAYELTGPENFISTGNWKMRKTNECRRISGITVPGQYQLKTILQYAGGKKENITSIEVPDLSFANNGIGDEDTVPKIWSPITVASDRTIKLWNRLYSFGTGPLPTAITVYGRPLFDKAPELIITTAAGRADIQYCAGKTTSTNRSVTLTGKGTASGFTIDYTTTVEFDGMIKFDFVINGQPKIKSMRLVWKVKPAYCQYLMTPLLESKPGPQFFFKYPTCESEEGTQLWLVSEGKGGFAYSMDNDANWVYDQSKPVFYVNKATGLCSVTMISKTVKLPQATPYQALFIATPTRPLPSRLREIRLNDIMRPDCPRLVMNDGKGLTGVATFQPHNKFGEVVKNAGRDTLGIYGMADSLTTGTPTANYFKKYWDIPGYYIYKMSYQKPLANGGFQHKIYLSLPACNATHIKDYLLGNIKELLEHPYGDRVWMIYYDLCGDTLCSNPLHGCGFKDKFGRKIKTFAILNKRKLVERTVRLCHKHDRVVMLHAQRYFYPFIHGLADYWFPGEQHSTLLRRNPYGYTDELSDDLYRSEYNRDVLGVGVIFLTALAQANPDYLKNHSLTEAMLTMLLAHDIETDSSWSSPLPHMKVWDIMEKYQVQSPETKAHLYYRQNIITSSNPDVLVTYYECPDNRYIVVLANKDFRSKKTEINLSKLKAGNYLVCDEYNNANFHVNNGKLKISVPPRSFRLIAFPPKPSFPINDNCSIMWGNWNSNNAKGDFVLDTTTGHKEPGSLLIRVADDNPNDDSFCFMKKIVVTPGKMYEAEVFAKVQNPAPGVKIGIGFQALDLNGIFLGLPPESTTIPGDKKEWQKLQLRFKIPLDGKWAETRILLVTLGVSNIKGGKVWFDDFKFSELE